MQDDVDDILSQLKEHTVEIKKSEDIKLEETDVKKFLITKTGTLVQTAIDSMQSIQQALGQSTDADEITALAKLIEASAKAIDTLNTLHNAQERNKTSKEVKQMEIDARERMNRDDNEVKKNLIFNREDLFKILTEPRVVKGEIIEEEHCSLADHQQCEA